MSFNITTPVKVVNPSADVDSLYGTYTSVIEACAGVPFSLREKGKTVGVIVNGSAVEYWWKSGTLDYQLVEKHPQRGVNMVIGFQIVNNDLIFASTNINSLQFRIDTNGDLIKIQ